MDTDPHEAQVVVVRKQVREIAEAVPRMSFSELSWTADGATEMLEEMERLAGSIQQRFLDLSPDVSVAKTGTVEVKLSLARSALETAGVLLTDVRVALENAPQVTAAERSSPEA